MPDHSDTNTPNGLVHGLAAAWTRAATAAVRPVSGVFGVAADAGLELERRAFDLVIRSDELERILNTIGNSELLRRAVPRALQSPSARELVDNFFDSGLFDHVVDRLLASDALWRLIDEVAQSPSVTAAISGQSLGFADQLGGEMRTRSRMADDWLERTARRVTHRRAAPSTDGSDGYSP
jgi:hypothetical protein